MLPFVHLTLFPQLPAPTLPHILPHLLPPQPLLNPFPSLSTQSHQYQRVPLTPSQNHLPWNLQQAHQWTGDLAEQSQQELTTTKLETSSPHNHRLISTPPADGNHYLANKHPQWRLSPLLHLQPPQWIPPSRASCHLASLQSKPCSLTPFPQMQSQKSTHWNWELSQLMLHQTLGFRTLTSPTCTASRSTITTTPRSTSHTTIDSWWTKSAPESSATTSTASSKTWRTGCSLQEAQHLSHHHWWP